MSTQEMQTTRSGDPHSEKAKALASSRGSVERTRDHAVQVPRTDIHETPEAIVLHVDMPGVDEHGVNITLEQDVLTLDGAYQEAEHPQYSAIYTEHEPTDYRRQFTLATQIDRKGIVATVKDGVLAVRLPKAEPARAQKIVVRAG